MNKDSSSNSSGGGSSSGGHYHSGGPIFIGGGGTRVETREVTKEVVKEVPKEPMPITCPFCSRSYVPVEQNYVCPSCGAATPKELIEESQMPGGGGER
jgi:DNA-directed RNA polymerase subunit RPC12/RpoP